MNSLANPPKYFRAPISRGGEPRVDRTGGYRNAGIIRGVSVISKGEALGHGMWIDNVTLEQVADAMNANQFGVKARYSHPSASGDSLGKNLGRVMEGEVEGERVVANQHFNNAAHKSPDGDLAEYLMTLAEEDPSAYGISIAFLQDHAAQEQFIAAHSVNGEFVSPDVLNVNNYPHVRISELHAADSVDSPAANPNGLFHREDDLAKQFDELAAYAFGLTKEQPTSTPLELDPSRVRGFATRFLTNRNIVVRKVNMAEQTAPVTTPATPAEQSGIKPGDRVTIKPGSEHDKSHVGLVGTVGEASTPALAIRFDDQPETPYKWYTADELQPATDEAPADQTPADTTPTQASAHTEAARFRAAFGDKGAVWFAEGLTIEQCRERQLSEMQNEIESLKMKLAARPLSGEDSPVTFDATDQKKNAGLASKIRVK